MDQYLIIGCYLIFLFEERKVDDVTVKFDDLLIKL